MTTKQQHNRLPASLLLTNGLTGGLLLLFLLFFSFPTTANEWQVEPGEGTLQAAIDAAQAGDTLRLTTGTYLGSIHINKTLTLLGSQSSVIDGQGSAHVILVSAPDVIVKGISIHRSGDVLEDEDSGVFITKEGDRTRIEGNFLEHNQIGVYLKGPESAVIIGNEILGSQHHRMNDRGNGVYLWNTPGSIVKDNIFRYGRDAIYISASHDNVFSGNHMSDLRFAVHYMYANNSIVRDNISTNNHVGYALMYSDRLTASGNLSKDDRDRGLFFNFANYSVIEGNRVTGGTEKCVFIYNSNFNQIRNNSFEQCNIGIHFTAGSQNNDVYNNAFINNRTQVKYVGTTYIEWSKDGIGNFWSDNIAFDIDGNGVADQAYKPNDLVDQIVWRHPLAKLLLNSPAVQVLKWAQGEFPGIHPGGVTDSVPLMKPPALLMTDTLLSNTFIR